jgi:SWI/SNF-related matrix-associated actin-dependent regulator 1 of chromatin subfamily A
MPFLSEKCPTCHKVAETEKVFKIGDKLVNRLKCGHLLLAKQLREASPEQIVSLDGKKLYKFQCDGVRFIEESNARALISDEMGLGKTPQSIAAIFLHPELQPFLVICKSSLKAQWRHEIMRWMGEDYFAQVIDTPNDLPLIGLRAFIMSYDILRRFDEKKKKKKNSPRSGAIDLEGSDERNNGQTDETTSKLITLIRKAKIKTIILDECQQIKNPEAQRTVHVRQICKEVDHVIALSGTPIKNNAAEYFPVLNILKPEMFPRYSTFLMNECDSYFTGYGYKTGGLKNPEAFLRKTSSFVIRRTRTEVLPDLPKIRRSFQFHELGKEVEKAYIETFKEFRDKYNSVSSDDMSFEESGNILAYLSKMRHLSGLSKINPCIDYVMEIMGSTDDRVTIFVHHKDVAEILESKLNSLFKELDIPPCARHEAGSSSLDTERSFEKSRVLICSTLAGGEGLNLQHLCRRFVMLERQWNPANEEQAEARFPRPEGIRTDFIDGVYMVAIGTVDEFFSEIVERKREIVTKTLGGEAAEWDQSSLIKELAETLSMSGGRRWSI